MNDEKKPEHIYTDDVRTHLRTQGGTLGRREGTAYLYMYNIAATQFGQEKKSHTISKKRIYIEYIC